MAVQTGKGFRVFIRGYSETLINLKLLKNQNVRLQKFLEKEAAKIVKTAKEIVHVDTGRLKDTHRILTWGATGKNFVRVTIIAGGIMMRGKFVNYAAVQHGRHPWLAMARDMHAPGFDVRLAKAIKIPKGKRRV